MPGNDEGRPPPGEPAHIEALQPTEPPTNSDFTPEHRQNINYAAALELAACAWEVVPCWWAGPRAKSPITKHGHLEATTDTDKIKLWWEKWPRAMIGARVPESGLVIDIDPRKGGSLAALEAITGPLPTTLTVWSGRNDGGCHLYYQRPPGQLTSTRLPQGIDLKANGYCIMPPSIHPATGQPYRWEHRPVEHVPNGLLNLLQPKPAPPVSDVRKAPTSKAVVGLLRTVANASEGNRNNVLFWASCRATENGVIDQIADLLIATALTSGLTETEARRTVASARRTTT